MDNELLELGLFFVGQLLTALAFLQESLDFSPNNVAQRSLPELLEFR